MCIPAVDESQVFMIVTSLVGMFRDWYDCSMFGIRRDMNLIETIVQQLFPVLNAHTQDLGVPVGLLLSSFLLRMFVELLPAESFFRLLDGVCYSVVVGKQHPFGMLIGVLLSALRVSMPQLLVAEEMESFKTTLDATFASMIHADIVLQNARVELQQLGYDHLMKLRSAAGVQLEQEDAMQSREEEMANRRLSVTGSLTQPQLEALMARAVREAGHLSSGAVTFEQFSHIILETNPSVQLNKHRTLFTLFDTDHNGTLDFKELAAACEALSGINHMGALRIFFVVFSAEPEVGLRFAELSEFFSVVLAQMQDKMSDKEMQSMSVHVFKVLKSGQIGNHSWVARQSWRSSLNDSADLLSGALSFEEFCGFQTEMPTIAHWLQMQCQSARRRWFDQPQDHHNETRLGSIFMKAKKIVGIV